MAIDNQDIHVARCKSQEALSNIEAASVLAKNEAESMGFLIEAKRYLREALLYTDKAYSALARFIYRCERCGECFNEGEELKYHMAECGV